MDQLNRLDPAMRLFLCGGRGSGPHAPLARERAGHPLADIADGASAVERNHRQIDPEYLLEHPAVPVHVVLVPANIAVEMHVEGDRAEVPRAREGDDETAGIELDVERGVVHADVGPLPPDEIGDLPLHDRRHAATITPN